MTYDKSMEAFDVQGIVGEGGRLTLEGLPYEQGSPVQVHVTRVITAPSAPVSPERTPEEQIEALHRIAMEIHAIKPDAPILTDYEMSRESIYEDERGL